MATRGVPLTVHYQAWNTSSNAGQTGDAANHTLRWVLDGTSAAPTNSPVEVDATNAPGIYKLDLTAAETDGNIGTLCGKSSTANVVIMPVTIQFERLPDAAPGSAGGIPVVHGSSTGGSMLLDSNGYVTAHSTTETGPFNLTVNVSSNGTPVPNAHVRIALAGYNVARFTDANGNASFAVSAGTWTVVVVATGYEGATVQVPVSGDTTTNVSLTKLSLAPSDPGFVTGYATCYDENGLPQSGVSVSLRLAGAAGSGLVGDSAERVAISNASGIVQFSNLQPGALYHIRRGTGSWVRVLIPTTASDPYELPSFVGVD